MVNSYAVCCCAAHDQMSLLRSSDEQFVIATSDSILSSGDSDSYYPQVVNLSEGENLCDHRFDLLGVVVVNGQVLPASAYDRRN